MESPMDIGGNSKTDDAAPSKPQARADIGSALRRQSQGDAPGTSSSERDSVDGERRRARVRIVHQSRRESVTLRIRDPGPLGITKELAHDAVTELIWRDKPQNALIVKRPQTQLATDALIDAANLLHRHGVTVYVEPSVYNELQDHRGVLTTWSSEERPNLSKLIDFSISLGGDGTILYMLTLFNNASVPPIVAFALGSLGFLTPFRVEDLTSAVTQFLQPYTAVPISLRMRLVCELYGSEHAQSGREVHALNEVVIDRGPSPFLTQMQLYVDDTFITEIQADGLIIATPTGSTAYSLSAGGSMVHPTVSAILLTPICPHSLSFRPIIVPDSVSLRIEIPGNARHSAWVSLDGRTRTELTTGCGVRIQASKYPVPAAIPSREHDDWYDNIKMHLHWNDRESQKPL